MSETPLRCSQCGKEPLDPYCIENCPKNLCEECGPKCNETNEDCDECPYEPDYDYDPELDEPTPEELANTLEEGAELDGEEDW